MGEMVDGVELLSQKLGVSLLREYRYVDDAIRKDDVMGVRLLMRMRNRRLIKDIYDVAEYLGMRNMCIDDLLQTPGYRVEIIYEYIAYGAARGGHRHLLSDMMEKYPYSCSDISFFAAKGGHIDIVHDMMKKGRTNRTWIACGAAEGGHKDIVMEMVSKGPYMRSPIACSAAKGGHKDILMEMVRTGTVDWQKIGEAAAMYGHRDIVLEILERENLLTEMCSYVLLQKVDTRI